MIFFVTQSALNGNKLKEITLVGESVMRLSSYLIAHEENDKDDKLKNQALLYFAERLEIAIQILRENKAEPRFFVYDMTEKEEFNERIS